MSDGDPVSDDPANEEGEEEDGDADTPVGIWRWVEPKSVSNKY